MAKWLLLLLFIIHSSLHASSRFLNQHEEGWYWHNDKLAVDKKEQQPESTHSQPNPEKTWKLIGQMVEQSRARAILNPTMSNITEARRMQRLVVTQANFFSERWMLSLLLHPELDENILNPNNSAGRTLYQEQNSALKETIIAKVSQQSSLYYFYQGGEPYSERMAEVVRDFALRYKMHLIPIAMNAHFSPTFPNSQIDSGLANQLRVKHIPAVFAMNPYTQEMMPVAYGLVSQSELKDNLFLATKAFKSGGAHES